MDDTLFEARTPDGTLIGYYNGVQPGAAGGDVTRNILPQGEALPPVEGNPSLFWPT